jgi:hypothetical protein
VRRRENPGGLGLFRPWLANEAENGDSDQVILFHANARAELRMERAGASLEWTEASRGESQPFRRSRNVTTATSIAASASMTG